MSSQPEIPNSISVDVLASLLDQRRSLPESSLIPELDFGVPLGGPCDLQFAINQLINRSVTGVNLVQMLSASLYLLTDIECHFDDQLTRLHTEEPPYDQATPAEQRKLSRLLTENRQQVRQAIAHLAPLLQSLCEPMTILRARQLASVRGQNAKELPLEDLRSFLLISDELLASLGLDRQAVTTYLNARISHD